MPISPRNCLLAVRVRNEEKLLPRFLDHHDCFYDKLIALVDRSADNSYRILRDHPKCVFIAERFSGKYDQGSDWTALKTIANSYPHEWLWTLDADEFVCHSFCDEMDKIPECAADISFSFLTLFPDSDHFINGNHEYALPFPRHKLHRRLHRVGFPLHYHVGETNTVSFPAWLAQSLVYHHNLIDSERRQAKFNLYMMIDPEGYGGTDTRRDNYKHIIEVSEASTMPLNGIHTRQKMIDYLISQKSQQTDISQIAYITQLLKFLKGLL